MSWLWLLWLLVPVMLAVVVYKATSPAFLVELATVAFKAALPVILKTSPHSKEYWDVKHQLMLGADKDDRRRLEQELKEILAKEAAGKLPLEPL